MADSADPVQKPTDLDLHCLQRQDISGFSMTRVNLTASAHKRDIYQIKRKLLSFKK